MTLIIRHRDFISRLHSSWTPLRCLCHRNLRCHSHYIAFAFLEFHRISSVSSYYVILPIWNLIMDKNVFFPKLSSWFPRGLANRPFDQSNNSSCDHFHRSTFADLSSRGANARFSHPRRRERSRSRENWSNDHGARNRTKTKPHREDMSGVGFLAAVKTLTPSGRRRRRCEKQQKVLELPPGYGMQPDVVPSWDAAPPITPPAAFLPPGYKKGFPGELARYIRALSRREKRFRTYGVK